MKSYEQELTNSTELELQKDELENEMEGVADMKKLYLNGYEKYGIEYQDMIHSYITKLEQLYGKDELSKLKLFHVVSGSTVEPDIHTGFDTPRNEISFFLKNGPALAELKLQQHKTVSPTKQ